MATPNIKPGEIAVYQSRLVEIVGVISLSEILVCYQNDKRLFKVPIAELSSPESTPLSTVIPVPVNEDQDPPWIKAKHRLQVLKPLLNSLVPRTHEMIVARANECGLGPATLYRWLHHYELSGTLTSLIRKKRADAGKKRLDPRMDQLMADVIRDTYLRKQRPQLRSSYQHLLLQVDQYNQAIKRAGNVPLLTPPSLNTFRNRIHEILPSDRIRRRKGRNAAQAHLPLKGSFPDADFPSAVWQIDHTELDIMLVDDLQRAVVGRPWITLVMDVYSRAVMGFYVSFDKPSSFSVGMAIASAILPKEAWLLQHQKALMEQLAAIGDDLEDSSIKTAIKELRWPCWGKPRKIYVDNGKEFHSKMLEKACEEHAIDIEYRPIKKAWFGAHIERLLGTFLREIHNLPGTTFSNTLEKGEYKSEAKASLTLSEFEVWLTTYILGVYHNRLHSETLSSPIDRYEKGILEGTPDHPPMPIPKRISGEEETKLRLDFMPFFDATIQRYGVRADNITYNHDVLRQYIGAKDGKNARFFTFRRDPRDISLVYFYDPKVERYYPIPCRNTAFPPMSLWEMRRATKKLKEERVKMIDENALLRAYRVMHHIVETADKETRKVRKQAQQKRLHSKAPKLVPIPQSTAPSTNPEKVPPEPFEDIDI